MAGLLRPVVVTLALAIVAGCSSVALFEPQQSQPVEVAAAPDAVGALTGTFASYVQTVHANGIVWFGANAITAQSGDFSDYDGGRGVAVGMAFGNGEDVRRFFEISYEESSDHIMQASGSSTVIGDIKHKRLFVGSRRYFVPVTGATRRMVPFLTAGLTFNAVYNSEAGGSASDPLVSRNSYIDGFGFSLGSGAEIHLNPQMALCLDARANFWNWEGSQAGTGYVSSAGASVSIAYHF